MLVSRVAIKAPRQTVRRRTRRFRAKFSEVVAADMVFYLTARGGEVGGDFAFLIFNTSQTHGKIIIPGKVSLSIANILVFSISWMNIAAALKNSRIIKVLQYWCVI
jgi:hypothetical protein